MLAAYYGHVKAIHIIFVVSWFAALFYLPRLFIYHTEAQRRPPAEAAVLAGQFVIMERLLWRVIMVPAMLLTIGSGLLMLHLQRAWLDFGWMHVKLGFVGGLLIYHVICGRLRTELAAGRFRLTSFQLRLWNEVATILLVAIVFLVVLKSAFDWVWGVLGVAAFAVLIMLAVRIARALRGGPTAPNGPAAP